MVVTRYCYNRHSFADCTVLQAKKLAIKNQLNNFITLYLIFNTFSPKYNIIYRKVSRETFYVLTDTFEPQQDYFDNFIVLKHFP